MRGVKFPVHALFAQSFTVLSSDQKHSERDKGRSSTAVNVVYRLYAHVRNTQARLNKAIAKNFLE
jgi:hypothetical protein